MRLAAIHGLVKLQSKAAVQALVERLTDSEPLIRKLAAARLKEFSGNDFGYVYSRNPESQAGAVDRYRAWAGAYNPKK
jgi:HEAT repeat protein